MRILQMIDILTTGGAQKLLVTFGLKAKLSGIQTQIVCLNSEVNSPVGQELQEMGLPVTYFPAPHLMDAKRMGKVALYLRKNRPDVIQTHLVYANIVGGLAGFATGIPVIATLHSTGQDAWNSKWQNWLEAQIMKRLDRRVIAVGYQTAVAHQHRLGGKKIDVIPNAVGLPVQITATERASLRREIIGDDAKLLLISVGKLRPAKAYDDLLRAFASLHSRYPQAVLVLVGDGDQRSDLEALSRTLELERSVLFLGNRTDVPYLLAASDLFLSSSVVEGMPLVVMEAMMAGLPVVATSVGDLPYMLTADCGILVPPSQPEQLANVAATLLEDEKKLKLMGMHAQEYAMHNFSSSAWLNKLTALYKEVCNKTVF